jgi:hypothetical protein
MSGPVQVIVIGFEAPPISREVIAELMRLGEAKVVRLVDVLLVRRDDDGVFDTMPPPSGLDPGLGRVAADILGGTDEPLAAEEGWSLADLVQPGSVAAVALIEHLWAVPLVDAIGSAAGRPLGELWLTPEDRARLPE